MGEECRKLKKFNVKIIKIDNLQFINALRSKYINILMGKKLMRNYAVKYL